MKKIIITLLLSFVGIAFTSCDYHDPNDGNFAPDTESGWVQFEKQDSTFVLTGGLVTEFTVPVTLKSPVNKSGLDIFYTVTDVNGTTDGILEHTGEMNIPSGQLTGNIVFKLISESALTSCVEYTITLASASRDNVQIGLEDGLRPVTHTVILGKGRDSFLGTYNSLEDGEFEYQSVVTAGDEPNELIITNVFGQDSNSETHVFLDPVSSNGNISYPNYSENYLFTDDSAGDLHVSNDYATFFPNESVKYSTYDSCEGIIDLNFFLVFGAVTELQTSSSINLMMTKQ